METDAAGRLAPGAQIVVRDEVWLIRRPVPAGPDGMKIEAVGTSDLVRGEEATFFTGLDDVQVLRPEETELVADPNDRNFRRARLFLEAVVRRTPLPQSEQRLAMAGQFLLDEKVYQQRPAELALSGLRPRILVADVVGLGKTLEIGLTLAELIRRGRGDRILVVTPQQVLDQFQRELWTRFSIPLIRLDSVGIQRIQQHIPAGRNPFTYFRRVIVSIDTLKDPNQYRHHLRNIHWDAVVIDESHNLIGGSSQRAQLADVLAPKTDALLLASATPHNGDARSFAELVNLLDPAAIADPAHYSTRDIDHLYIRRTKVSPEVRDQLKNEWADRGPSVPVRCAATPPEESVFGELAREWLPRAEGTGRSAHDRLFPYTLLKAFLSSHVALEETVKNRLSSGDRGEEERAALERLNGLAAAIGDDHSAKLAALVEQLRQIGVGPRSGVRVVVFSERVPTLDWLAKVVPQRLGFTARNAGDAVEVLHGGRSDKEQQEVLERFGLAESPLRLLFTGDLASEGIDLHRECAHLIHYDLPWSLIRIEQRNGRIDRYGQQRSPEFRALILTSSVDGAKDDTTVAEKLLARESEVHTTLGTVEPVTGEYSADREENRLIKDLLSGKTVEESLAAGPGGPGFDLLAELSAEVGAGQVLAPPERAPVPALFGSTEDFFDEAIHEVVPNPEKELRLNREGAFIALDPPEDLKHRLSVLPPSYLSQQRVHERLKVTFDRGLAGERLRAAQSKEKILWPDTAYLTDLHPLVEWLVDKLLVKFGRQEAPVVTARVAEPVFLVQGIYSNEVGQPVVCEWMAVSGLPHAPRVRPMFDVLASAGVGPGMANTGRDVNLDRLRDLRPLALKEAREHLEQAKTAWEQEIAEPLRDDYEKRFSHWEQMRLSQGAAPGQRRDTAKATLDRQRDLADSLLTAGAPLLRLLAVLEAAE